MKKLTNTALPSDTLHKLINNPKLLHLAVEFLKQDDWTGIYKPADRRNQLLSALNFVCWSNC